MINEGKMVRVIKGANKEKEGIAKGNMAMSKAQSLIGQKISLERAPNLVLVEFGNGGKDFIEESYLEIMS